MKLDPNLEKFRDVHIRDIKRGWLDRVMPQARDYLAYIHNDDLKKINQEMDNFANHLREYKKQFVQRKKVNHDSNKRT